MKVWGDHTKDMDHLQRRAARHLAAARPQKSSEVSKMSPLSAVEQRKVAYEQRAKRKFHTNTNPYKVER
ncbi:hypothetical protein [Magnetovibrio sp.]|uniref:hypothetical protein n=1 Tax=Magnetovibrio sp. TaxID=2024836 RepID=UPI002F931AF5